MLGILYGTAERSPTFKGHHFLSRGAHNEKKLHAGDFIRADSGRVDHRVWSETGCTCVLLTSTKDEILKPTI